VICKLSNIISCCCKMRFVLDISSSGSLIRALVFAGTGTGTGTPSGMLSPLGFGDGERTCPVSFDGDRDGKSFPHGDGDGRAIPDGEFPVAIFMRDPTRALSWRPTGTPAHAEMARAGEIPCALAILQKRPQTPPNL